MLYTQPATGTDVASESAGGKEYQQVKLIAGNVGSTQPIKGTTANGMEVDVTRVQGGVTQEIGSVTVSGVAATVKQVFVDALTGADRTIVSAVSGKAIRVIGLSLSFTAAANLTIKTGATTNLTNMTFAANGQWMASGFVFQTTTANQDLIFNVSAGSVRGTLTYVEV